MTQIAAHIIEDEGRLFLAFASPEACVIPIHIDDESDAMAWAKKAYRPMLDKVLKKYPDAPFKQNAMTAVLYTIRPPKGWK